jgi:hypothetical protein
MRIDKLGRALRDDERGVALPLALFGLVAVSVLITAALVTSSTELALSQAHQDGARGLYEADASLEQFVASRAAMVVDTDQRLVNGAFEVALPSGPTFGIDVAELFRGAVVTLPGGELQRREKFSLVAAPQSSWGRSVGALIEVTRTSLPMSLNVDSGLTLGTNTTVSGSATISDGSSAGAACDSASAPAAIRHASGTEITQQGASEIIGDVVLDDRDAAQLMDYVLDEHSVDELADLAHIKFGPRFNKPAFSGTPSHTATDVSYRWGCPPQLVVGCTPDQTTFFPTVAIDGNGGTVDITGVHGQGIIVVVNGNIHIRGNFVFAGIVIVEGTLWVTGTPRLEGAVIAMGDEAVIDPGDDSELSSGNSLIRYNQCQVVQAVQSLTMQSLNAAPQVIDTPTYAWFEVVR